MGSWSGTSGGQSSATARAPPVCSRGADKAQLGSGATSSSRQKRAVLGSSHGCCDPSPAPTISCGYDTISVLPFTSCLPQALPSPSTSYFSFYSLPVFPFCYFLSLSPNHFLDIQPTSSSPFCHFLSPPWASPGASCAQSLAPRVPDSDLIQRVLLSSVGNFRSGVGLRTFSSRFPLKWLQSCLHKGTSLSTFVHEL